VPHFVAAKVEERVFLVILQNIGQQILHKPGSLGLAGADLGHDFGFFPEMRQLRVGKGKLKVRVGLHQRDQGQPRFPGSAQKPLQFVRRKGVLARQERIGLEGKGVFVFDQKRVNAISGQPLDPIHQIRLVRHLVFQVQVNALDGTRRHVDFFHLHRSLVIAQ
jgi:hypothetical protein